MDNNSPTVTFFTVQEDLFQDERGWALFPFQGESSSKTGPLDWASLHVVSTEPGQVRGNHVHPETGEWLVVFQGTGRFHWVDNGHARTRDLSGPNQVVFIPAGIPHAVRNVGNQPLLLMAVRAQKTAGPHTRPSSII